MSYFVELENADGQTRTTWDVDLQRVAREQSLNVGDTVVLQNLGRTPVEVKQDILDEHGKVIGSEMVVSHRNQWEIEFVGRTRQAEDHGKTEERDMTNTASKPDHASISFVDARAWWTDQHAIIQSLAISYAEMEVDLERIGSKPSAGQVYWFDGGRPIDPPPNAAHILGQHSSSEKHAAATGRLVMHAISTLPDSKFIPSLLLFKSGYDNYLQGFVYIGDQKQPVIAHIVNAGAGKADPTIRLSAISMTPDGPRWREIGSGRAINASKDGGPVYFDEVRFTVGDSTLVARVNKELGFSLHQKIGFEKPQIARSKDRSAGAPIMPKPTPSKTGSDNATTYSPPLRKQSRHRNAPK